MTNAVTETTYILQSSEFRDGRWTPWSCCSPQHKTLHGAREQYERLVQCDYFPQMVRLVRVTGRWKNIPGVRCAYNAGSRLLVYETKELRCVNQLEAAK